MAKITTHLAAALALSGATLSGAALAAPAFAESPIDQAPSVAVRTNDLDLASERGAQILARRVQRAAMEVCPAHDPANVGMTAAIDACRATALASGQARAQVALARAREGKALAANTAKAPAPGF